MAKVMAGVPATTCAGTLARAFSSVVGGRRSDVQQLGHAVQARDAGEALRQVREDEVAVEALGFAQPGEQQRERRGIELADLAQVDAASAGGDRGLAFAER